MQEDLRYFCHINVSSHTQMVIEIVLVSLSVLLIGDAVHKFCRMWGQQNKRVTFIYIMILIWWINFVATSIYNVKLYVDYSADAGFFDDQEMSYLSKFSFILDWLNAYEMQCLLLYVPLHWAKKISDLFSQIDRGSEISDQPLLKYKGYQRKIFITLRFYMLVRLGLLALPIAVGIISEFEIIYEIMMLSLLLDCVFITFSLLIGMFSLKTTPQLKELLDEDQTKRMFNQYIMIIFANTIRFGFDLFFLISLPLDPDYCQTCPYNPQSDQPFNIVFKICSFLLMHYLPIFLILRIYNPQEKPQQICKSLIITTSDNQ